MENTSTDGEANRVSCQHAAKVPWRRVHGLLTADGCDLRLDFNAIDDLVPADVEPAVIGQAG